MTSLHIDANTSLSSFFRRQATRWALVGFFMTLGFAIPCVLYSAKIASERQVATTARAAARAFRATILQNDIRYVEYQMRHALGLKDDESALIYDTNFNAVFPLKETDKVPPCRTPDHFCWGKGFQEVSFLYPIYFDEEHQTELYGYLALTLKPTLDLAILSAFVLLILVGFIAQAFGLSSALGQSAKVITDQLLSWSQHLQFSPSARRTSTQPTRFLELGSMQEAVDGLHFKIDELQKEAARKAKYEAQVSILREIGHDLRTPHALAAKYFALHVDTLEKTGVANPSEINRVLRTLKRMGELLRMARLVNFNADRPVETLNDGHLAQTSLLNTGHSKSPSEPTEERCFLNVETATILEDLRNDPDVVEKGVEIEAIPEAQFYEARISRLAYYRLLENLVHNACNAVKEFEGKITIKLSTINDALTLSVMDNGCGISPENRNRIFDLDFTTKPSRGTGLGLNIVKGICDEVGATISFESILNEGTTFTVTFPKLTESNSIEVRGNSCHNTTF